MVDKVVKEEVEYSAKLVSDEVEFSESFDIKTEVLDPLSLDVEPNASKPITTTAICENKDIIKIEEQPSSLSTSFRSRCLKLQQPTVQGYATFRFFKHERFSIYQIILPYSKSKSPKYLKDYLIFNSCSSKGLKGRLFISSKCFESSCMNLDETDWINVKVEFTDGSNLVSLTFVKKGITMQAFLPIDVHNLKNVLRNNENFLLKLCT